jgi:PAS domain S-box-containing protein
MTSPLTAALAELRRQFADQLGIRLAAVREKFEQIDCASVMATDLEGLHRLVHGLTGSAGTFGMNSVSDVARTLEQKLATLIKDGQSAIAPADWAEATGALERLERIAAIRLESQAPILQPLSLLPPRTAGAALIHVVEDDADQAQHIAAALRSHGYPVHIYPDTLTFQAALQAGAIPAAVVMDMIFADDADAGAKSILALRETLGECPPVVFLSVRDDTTARLAAYRAGASRYFSKPVNTDRLVRILDELTGRQPPQRYRVLLVDDDPLLVQAQAAVLHQAGMEVTTLTEPLRVLDTIATCKPDVLILDVYMPDASGPEIAAILREQDAFAHLPILFLSAETDMSNQLLALNLGGDDFLVKPVRPAHLVAAVTARARRARQNGEMMSHLKTMLYEREREHLALNHHAIVSISDIAGNITYANEKFCDVSGYSYEELHGHNHRLLKSGRHLPTFYAEMWNTIAGGNIWSGEICNRKKNGELYWVESTITPFLDHNGKPYQYVAIRTEITALKAREQELIEARTLAETANRAKSEFLSNMSHEFRTPMNAILGFAQLLDFDETVAAVHKDEVREILKAGRHLLEIINEILDLAKIESGRIDLSIEPTALAPLIEECIGLIRPLAEQRSIVLQQHGFTTQAVRADRTRLRQVLLNLLSNGIKYNRDGGRIDLSLASGTEGKLRIAVADTGIGIAATNLGELFQPFSRLGAESGSIEGTGIGLVITRRLIESMGGAVGVESTAGTGSTFWVELPAAEPMGDPSVTATIEGDHAFLNGGHGASRILYIEDNPANLRLVAQILGRHRNVHLITAHAPQLGIELAMAQTPDLILLDINMPEINGFQVLKLLKADARTQQVPVVAISANAMPRDIAQGLAAGFVEYLTKPLDVERFLAVVDHCLAS